MVFKYISEGINRGHDPVQALIENKLRNVVEDEGKKQ